MKKSICAILTATMLTAAGLSAFAQETDSLEVAVRDLSSGDVSEKTYTLEEGTPVSSPAFAADGLVLASIPSQDELMLDEILDIEEETEDTLIEAETEAAAPAGFGSDVTLNGGILAHGADMITLGNVIGADERYALSYADRTAYPYSCVVYLAIEFPYATRVATGFMVGSRTVVTAASCLYNPNYGGWADTITVVPGMDNYSMPFGAATSTETIVPQAWIDGGEARFDFGVIHTQEAIGNSTGWLGISYNDGASYTGGIVLVPGYTLGNNLAMAASYVANSDSTWIDFDADTDAAAVGAPVIWPTETDYYVIGINRGFDSGLNYGVRVTENVFNFIVKEIQ